MKDTSQTHTRYHRRLCRCDLAIFSTKTLFPHIELWRKYIPSQNGLKLSISQSKLNFSRAPSFLLRLFKDNQTVRNAALSVGSSPTHRMFLKNSEDKRKKVFKEENFVSALSVSLFDFPGQVFGPERLCSHRPDSSDPRQWILQSDRYKHQTWWPYIFPVIMNVHPFFFFFLYRRLLSDVALDPSDKSPEFYVNVCQPLNPIPGVTCPAGAAVCVDPVNGPPMVRQPEQRQHVKFKFI